MSISILHPSTARPTCWATALALLLPLTVGAQEPAGTPVPDDDRRHCVCLDPTEISRSVAFMAFPRVRLGVALGATTTIGDRTGVRVDDVTDGAPAARAGIRPGDVILSLDGRRLGSEPAREIRRLLADREVGDTVTVELHRDGRDLTVRAVAERAPATVRAFSRLPDGFSLRPARPGAPLAPAVRELRSTALAARLARDGLQLAAINPGLGRYFGVDEGVLVVNVTDGTGLDLQAGDVIMTIGGRSPTDAAHARAMLGSYRADEEVVLEVMRDRRRITLRGNRTGP